MPQPPGPFGLSPAEERCIRHLAAGYTPRETARILHVSYSTVKTHIQNIRVTMGMTSVTHDNNLHAIVAKWIREVEHSEQLRAAYLKGLWDGTVMRRAERIQLRALADPEPRRRNAA